MINIDKQNQFLMGLEKITRETGLTITGCGHCGGPGLIELKDMPPEAGYGYCDIASFNEVTWISPDDEWRWLNFRDTIAKP